MWATCLPWYGVWVVVGGDDGWWVVYGGGLSACWGARRRFLYLLFVDELGEWGTLSLLLHLGVAGVQLAHR